MSETMAMFVMTVHVLFSPFHTFLFFATVIEAAPIEVLRT